MWVIAWKYTCWKRYSSNYKSTIFHIQDLQIKAQGIMKKAFSLKGKVIDHKNGNRSNNSLSNLRGTSYSKNNSNKHGHLYPHARDIYGKWPTQNINIKQNNNNKQNNKQNSSPRPLRRAFLFPFHKFFSYHSPILHFSHLSSSPTTPFIL